ncbi:methyltransferase [Metallosphaera sedula]|uniref:Methyltransferase n=3 Tax=Metallosphaera TaxID=41980 RepID=A4YEQ4_METS5|nr:MULTISPECIES: METTL5 family protein [Metallosphaera]ABP94906.1 methyltransferase [Metallosphaera sedula DSM 5348]AIM26893.1 methyltransferase [Metallosphaera sedula]MCY0862390.1 METTL5 family protein [Metallosphaera prunae]QCO29577.1 methyltransferase domain-containing protein [Metallosphaera prunae]WPX06931.1 METTL5 family protein [Metallosphaera sedula DSM 5348]
MEQIPPHPSPKWELEQYLTPSPIASTLVWTAFLQGAIEGRKVADLGCGTGRLCAGVAALSGECTCVDVDRESLEIGKDALRELELEADFVEADCSEFHGRFHTVVQNPPFGQAKRGMDLKFLRTALKIAEVVYSIHKSNPESRDLIFREARAHGFSVDVVPLSYPMTPYYPWHRERVHRFLVDIYVFRKSTG